MDTIFLDKDLDELLAAVRDTRLLSFDVETTGLNPIDSRMLLCQIGAGDKSFVVDARKVNLGPLIPYMTDAEWTKIIHQAKFEQSFVQHFYKHPIAGVYDTMLAEGVIDPDLRGRVSLNAVSIKYLGRELDKSIRESFFNMPDSREFTQEQIAYASADSDVLFGIREAQLPQIKDLDLEAIAELEFQVAGVAAAMELTGVPIDKTRWAELITEYGVKHEESRLKMHEILYDQGGLPEQTALFVRDNIDLGSPKQIIEAFEKLGIKVPVLVDKRTGKSRKTVDERALQMIDHPAAREMLKYREYDKALTSYDSTFLDKIHPFDGRIHAEFNQLGTETGRFSCEKPNLQQLPADFRKCVADPDYLVISADYANIELRILAELSGDPALTKAFLGGSDPHKATAAMMFNIPLDTVTKEQRFIAKTINFGISYGMGAKKLMDQLNQGKPTRERLNFVEVMNLHKKYKVIYRTAMSWLEETGKLGFRSGFSRTLLGRKRFYRRPNRDDLDEKEYERQLGGLLRQAANSPIQGSNADITKIAMVKLDARLREEGWKANIMAQVHDEIVLLAHKKQAEQVKTVVEEVMIEAAQELVKSVPIKVDAIVSESWNK